MLNPESCSILLVTGSPARLRAWRDSVLADTSYLLDVLSATTPAEARRLFHARCPDCIVVDGRLPEQQARDIVAAVRSQYGEHAAAIVMVVDEAHAAVGRAALAHGVHDYVVIGARPGGALVRSVARAREKLVLLRELDAMHRQLALSSVADRTEPGTRPRGMVALPGAERAHAPHEAASKDVSDAAARASLPAKPQRGRSSLQRRRASAAMAGSMAVSHVGAAALPAGRAESRRGLARAGAAADRHVAPAELQRLIRLLGRRERELHTLLANIPETVTRVPAERPYQGLAVPTIATTVGWPAHVLGALDHEPVVAPNVSALLDRSIADVFATGCRCELEIGAEVDHVQHTYTVRLAPEIDAAGAVESVLVIALDVTDVKQSEADHARSLARAQVVHDEAEMLRRIDRLKSEFVANVSHDLRTPLHHIKGFASTLLRPQIAFDAATTREYLRIIVDECDTLERLVSDLLDTSRLETGKFALIIDSVDVGALVHQAVLRWQRMSNRLFAVDVQGTPPPVPADPKRILQVLDNLLANVVRHTPPQTAAVVSVSSNRNELIVAVRDHGPGIRAEHLPYVFDRFYQASDDLDRDLRGSGLGLFISKGIVELHGGRIWVEAMPHGGTQFSFSLPRRRQKPKPATIAG